MGRFKLVAIALCLFIAACDQDPNSVACPYLRRYDRATQDRALAELRALPKGSAIRLMIGDYSNLREQVRACRGER